LARRVRLPVPHEHILLFFPFTSIRQRNLFAVALPDPGTSIVVIFSLISYLVFLVICFPQAYNQLKQDGLPKFSALQFPNLF
jgi:hypothetical protein